MSLIPSSSPLTDTQKTTSQIIASVQAIQSVVLRYRDQIDKLLFANRYGLTIAAILTAIDTDGGQLYDAMADAYALTHGLDSTSMAIDAHWAHCTKVAGGTLTHTEPAP